MSVKHNKVGQWHVDLGAAILVTDNMNKFISLISYTSPSMIVMGDGSHHQTLHTENITIPLKGVNISLSNVLLIPVI